jgi:hypothetical protein
MTAAGENLCLPDAASPQPRAGLLQSDFRLTALCLLGIVCNALAFGPSLRFTATGHSDFMSIYSGTRLAFTGGMYNVDQNLRVMRESAGWENLHHLFLRPPFDALLMWPFGLLPYPKAAVAWEILIVLAVVLFCYFWPGNRRMAALVCCWSLPLFDSLAEGQDIALLLLLIALAMREIRRGRPIAAALLLSLCSIKLHLFLLLPVLIFRRRLWRLGLGVLVGGAVLFAVSFLPGGWKWPANYLAILNNPISNPWAEVMPTVRGLASVLPHPMLWQVFGIAAVFVMVWVATRKFSFEYGLAAALIGGILVAPHAYPQDCALIIPALLVTYKFVSTTWERHFHVLLACPFLGICTFFHASWITAIALLLYLAWMTVRGHQFFDCNPSKLSI